MSAQLITFLILVPFALAFIYAAYHEYRRYKTEGRASYGLVYNEETGTTHVTGIADEEEAYDPEDYDPNDYSDPDIASDPDEDDKSKS
jgi:hypothetical protein